MKNEIYRMMGVISLVAIVIVAVQCTKEEPLKNTTDSAPKIVYVQNNLKSAGVLGVDEVDGVWRISDVRKDGSVYEFMVSDNFPTEEELEWAMSKLSEDDDIAEKLKDPEFDGTFDDPEMTEAYDVIGRMFEDILPKLIAEREKF